MGKPPRRLTPEESDARVAHIPPALRRALMVHFVVRLRRAGVDAELFTDRTGRAFIRVDVDEVRTKLGAEAATMFEEFAAISSLPAGHTPPVA